jgi:predicted nucleic acid-binding protein
MRDDFFDINILTYAASADDHRFDIDDRAVALAQRYGLSIFDATIVGSALLASCRRLISEDMHHGLVIEGKLTIHNPFRG